MEISYFLFQKSTGQVTLVVALEDVLLAQEAKSWFSNNISAFQSDLPEHDHSLVQNLIGLGVIGALESLFKLFIDKRAQKLGRFDIFIDKELEISCYHLFEHSIVVERVVQEFVHFILRNV